MGLEASGRDGGWGVGLLSNRVWVTRIICAFVIILIVEN